MSDPNVTKAASLFKKDLKQVDSRLETMFKDYDGENCNDREFNDFIETFKDYESILKEYSNYIDKNGDSLAKGVKSKHLAYLKENTSSLMDKQNRIKKFAKNKKENDRLMEVKRALNVVMSELSSKIKERAKWDLPEKYAKYSRDELKKHVARLEQMVNQDGSDKQLRADWLALKEYVSDSCIQAVNKLDREIEMLQMRRDILVKELEHKLLHNRIASSN